MDLSRLQEKIKKTLENNSFKVIQDILTNDKFVVVSNFGQNLDRLEKSTFYINKIVGTDNLIIGANIELDAHTLTKSMLNKVQLISARHNVSCAPVKYNVDKDGNDKGILSLQIVYKFLKFNEKNFLLYVNNFRECIRVLYGDIQKYLQHQDTIYLDLSMFESADWSIFDPYTYIMERDKKYNGSWERYAEHLKKNLNKKERLVELLYVDMCKQFEEKNDIPIDLACDYIIDRIMQHVTEENSEEKVVN